MPVQITNFTGTLWTGITSGFMQFMNFLPALLGALIILAAGWFVAKFIGRLIERVLIAAKLETAVEKAQVNQYLPVTRRGHRMSFSAILGAMAKWFVFLIFIQTAANTLGVIQITWVINQITLFIPKVIVASIILVLGSWASNYFSGVVERSTAGLGIDSPKLPSVLVKYGILGFAVIAAVSELGIATNLINILFTGLVASLAIAFGLAFGLGGRGAAADVTRSFINKSSSYSGSGLINKSEEIKDSSHH